MYVYIHSSTLISTKPVIEIFHFQICSSHLCTLQNLPDVGVISREVAREERGGKERTVERRAKESSDRPRAGPRFTPILRTAARAPRSRSRSPSAHPSCSCSPARPPACPSGEGAPKICVVASSFCLKMNSVCESDQNDEGAFAFEQPAKGREGENCANVIGAIRIMEDSASAS